MYVHIYRQRERKGVHYALSSEWACPQETYSRVDKAGKVNKIYEVGSMHVKDDRITLPKDLIRFES